MWKYSTQPNEQTGDGLVLAYRAGAELIAIEHNLWHLGDVKWPPCSSSLEDFREALTRESHTLKRALTDPRLLDGIGNAYYEQLVYNEDAQLLNASFADYLVPTASEVPRIRIGHEITRSPLNELGSKGVGEAGTIPVTALFAQTLENALADYDIEITETPMSPNRLFELLEAAKK